MKAANHTDHVRLFWLHQAEPLYNIAVEYHRLACRLDREGRADEAAEVCRDVLRKRVAADAFIAEARRVS